MGVRALSWKEKLGKLNKKAYLYICDTLDGNIKNVNPSRLAVSRWLMEMAIKTDAPKAKAKGYADLVKQMHNDKHTGRRKKIKEPEFDIGDKDAVEKGEQSSDNQ